MPFAHLDDECRSLNTSESPDIALQLQGADWSQTRLLRFKDGRLERLFSEDGADRRRRLVVRSHYFFIFLAWTEYLLHDNHKLLSSAVTAPVCVSASRLTWNIFVCVSFVLARLGGNVEVICWAVFLVTPIFMHTSNRYRMTNFFDDWSWYYDFLDCAKEACIDDSALVLTLIVTALLPMVMSMRVFLALWVCLHAGISYPMFAYLSPLGTAGSAVNALMIGTVCIVLLLGMWKLETERRQRFRDAFELRVQVATQREEMLRQNRWLDEVHSRLEAFGIVDEPAKLYQRPEHAGSSQLLDGPEDTHSAYKCPLTVPDLHTFQLRTPSASSTAIPSVESFSYGGTKGPNDLLYRTLVGKTCDPKRLRKMALHLGDPEYSLSMFFEDACTTFPELELFTVVQNLATSSGLSGEVEYQRTIGALFAVYWLARLEIDGKEGFCYGCDRDWLSHTAAPAGEAKTLRTKRRAFHHDMKWVYFEKVFKDAIEDKVERLEAMLCLTAFHDIMKMPPLCPEVLDETGSYEGYAVGSIINDHDLALAYVLEFYPELLPSYMILPKASQELILFSQGKLHFNHGWFVQAEAPPGPMLSKFREALCHSSGADLAFYFLHWLTDLSGAEGRPLAGAEKFVLLFPRSVLLAFLWSIPFLQQLTTHTETEVFERYLVARYQEALPTEAMPIGQETVAILRLIVMAQDGCGSVLGAFYKLPSNMQGVLIEELARTGLPHQQYKFSPQFGGPAMFVYYGPALLQSCSREEEMEEALRFLAAVYYAARQLWPIADDAADSFVTLEAGWVKANAANIVSKKIDLNGQLIIVERRSANEGVVRGATGAVCNGLMTSNCAFRAVDVNTPWLMAMGANRSDFCVGDDSRTVVRC